MTKKVRCLRTSFPITMQGNEITRLLASLHALFVYAFHLHWGGSNNINLFLLSISFIKYKCFIVRWWLV